MAGHERISGENGARIVAESRRDLADGISSLAETPAIDEPSMRVL